MHQTRARKIMNYVSVGRYMHALAVLKKIMSDTGSSTSVSTPTRTRHGNKCEGVRVC